MTIRYSTSVRNAFCNNKGFATIFNRGSINVYSGTQPASADSAATGTLLGTITLNSGALTQETRASATITVAGASGSVDTVTVGGLNIIPTGAVPFDTDAATTAAKLALAINQCGMFEAAIAGAVVTVMPNRGSGATFNGVALATTVTTLTATSSGNLTGGVNPVNGLTFATELNGALTKSGVWSFDGVAVGTAGWFRFIASSSDHGGSSTTLERMDGSIAVSGADMALSNISITVSAPNTVDSFKWTYPAQ